VIVLGISETHCATAAVLRDGEIVGCASEERFSRLKNGIGPRARGRHEGIAEYTEVKSVVLNLG